MSPCPLNVGVQGLVTEPRQTTLRGTRGAREGKKQRLRLRLSETVASKSTCPGLLDDDSPVIAFPALSGGKQIPQRTWSALWEGLPFDKFDFEMIDRKSKGKTRPFLLHLLAPP